jgi:hypothetical protein
MQKKALLVLIMTTIVHLILQFIYRPYIYDRYLFDFNFAYSFPNLTAVIGISAIMVLIDSKQLYQNKRMQSLILIIPTLGVLLYEVVQLFIPWLTFSVMDIVYTLVGGLLNVFVKKFVYDRA